MGSREPAIEPSGAGTEPDDARTSPSLLDRVRDWGDHPAWADFYERYDPLLHRWCGRFSLDADTSDELCQRIWMELMARMRTFRYDPSRGFRRWLWRLFRSRAIDMLRQRRTAQAPALERLTPVRRERPLSECEAVAGHEPMGPGTSPVLIVLAEEAQAAVRARVDAETWRAYWIVAIEDRPIREAAECLGKSYTAVYTGYKRVDRMLRAEGGRRLTALLGSDSKSRTG
jgi:RNA polymerase sigma-70 factor (ECF subfamily)